MPVVSVPEQVFEERRQNATHAHALPHLHAISIESFRFEVPAKPPNIRLFKHRAMDGKSHHVRNG